MYKLDNFRPVCPVSCIIYQVYLYGIHWKAISRNKIIIIIIIIIIITSVHATNTVVYDESDAT